MDRYDVVIVGSGTAGYNVAKACRREGLSVAVAERDVPGGTCALRGCQPKKFFVVQAALAQTCHHLVGKGVAAAPSLSWPEAAAFKSAFTAAVPGNTEAFFAKIGADLLRGEAALAGPGRVRIADREIAAGAVVLATGARPRRLGVPGEDLTLDSRDFLDLAEMPESVLFVGGGYIAFEFAHVAAAYGAEVTLLNRSEHMLRAFDPDLAAEAVAGGRAVGIAVHGNQEPAGFERRRDGVRVVCRSGACFEAAAVVVAVGRDAEFTGLGLETVGAEPDPRGLPVDPQMRVRGTDGLYAVGDCARTVQLAPVADREGLVAAATIAGREAAMDYRAVPSVCFTRPPLAAVGLGEAAATAAGLDFRIERGDMTAWANHRRLGAVQGAYKLLVGADGALLGAHLLGHEAGEMINVLALALHARLPAATLREVMWAYPTLTSDLKYMP